LRGAVTLPSRSWWQNVLDLYLGRARNCGGAWHGRHYPGVCGDCSEPILLEIAGGKLKRSEGIIHFAVPAHHWWDNIGFT
jgi:hypothetical protein